MTPEKDHGNPRWSKSLETAEQERIILRGHKIEEKEVRGQTGRIPLSLDENFWVDITMYNYVLN